MMSTVRSELPSRKFGDPNAMRSAIYDYALLASQSLPPVSNNQHVLQLQDVRYEDPAERSYADEKKAILEGGSLHRRLRGTWRLTDKATGNVLDENRTTIAKIPHVTSSGTYILGGTEYGLSHQLRLRPGVYTRIKQTGDIASHANVAGGIGHHYYLNPETGIFRIDIGQAKMPLLPLLRSLGVPDSAIRKAWGDKLYAANVKTKDSGVIRKLYQRLYRNQNVSDTKDMAQAVQAAFQRMLLDPEVSKKTLDVPYNRLNADAILAITKKLRAVNLEELPTDDRDSLEFQRIVGPEDLFEERLRKTVPLLRKLLWKATFTKNLSHIPTDTFRKFIRGTIYDSGLGGQIQGINPAEVYDHSWRVTRMGEGGITSLDAIPESARGVQPSHLGFIDALQTPESDRVGVEGRIAINTQKGADTRLYSEFRDAKTGKPIKVSPQDLAGLIIAFPGEMEKGTPVVRAIVDGQLRFVSRGSVEVQAPHMTNAFGPLANLIPFKPATHGQRVSMGARMISQALPLADPEAPFVQSAMPGSSKSFEEHFGPQMGAIFSNYDGVVVDTSPTQIKIRDRDRHIHIVELYNHRPYARKTFLHNTPTVAAGTRIRKGDLLARSNFTDAKGTTALGKNVRVGYISFRGLNYEDATVVSESFAKRFSSEHMVSHELDLDADTRASKNAFIAIFPRKYTRKLLEKFDKNGVIRPGEQVESDDPLILGIRENKTGMRLGRSRRNFSDASVIWKHKDPGVVTDVFKSPKRINVFVKSLQPLQQGDKLVGRYANKGVVAAIIPDDQMPIDEEGRPLECLLNPLGIVSRGNPSQLLEAALGKIVAKTGIPYKVEDFDGTKRNLTQWVISELKKHGLSDTETVTDPVTGRKIPGIMVGNRFIMKLHHVAESKLAGRGIGSYTAEETPATGGSTSAKRVGMLDLNAILSHGAYNVARDASAVRGQRNADYWRQIMSGYPPPTIGPSFVYRKFLSQLQAAGINPVRRGSKVQLMAMTNDAIKKLSGDRELDNASTVDWRVNRLTPIRGGLFDEKLTGGHGANRWSSIRLTEPMPNPVMEEPIRRLLGLTQNEFEQVIAGKKQLGSFADTLAGTTKTGPAAIADALSKIDVDKEIEKARADINSGKRTYRDLAVRRLGYLKGAKASGIHPKEWIWNHVPVLPPAFRPVSVLQNNQVPLVADANYLYQEVFNANHALEKLKTQIDDVSEERLSLYRAIKAVTGLGSPARVEHKEKGIRGILRHVIGESPKYGIVQKKLLGSTVDLAGRATITPNPNLDIDEIGIPVEKAWEVYRPFIVRRLVRRGMRTSHAIDATENRTAVAADAMQKEMESRPVLVARAPVLHRYGVMAFRPILTRSDTVEVPPPVTPGFGADFDGDAVQFHVPADADAVNEAYEKMLPSRNLFSTGTFMPQYGLTQEFLAGLWDASTKQNNRPVQVYAKKQDAIRAYRRGEIGLGQKIEILSSD